MWVLSLLSFYWYCYCRHRCRRYHISWKLLYLELIATGCNLRRSLSSPIAKLMRRISRCCHCHDSLIHKHIIMLSCRCYSVIMAGWNWLQWRQSTQHLVHSDANKPTGSKDVSFHGTSGECCLFVSLSFTAVKLHVLIYFVKEMLMCFSRVFIVNHQWYPVISVYIFIINK